MVKFCENKILIICIGISVAIFCSALFLIGCGGGDGGSSDFTASDGDYGGGNDNESGIYFKVIDNKIYNLRLSMTNPPFDGNCLTITGASITRPGESEPFMEFVEPIYSDQLQETLYFDQIEIGGDGEFVVEETIAPTPIFCEQALTISGTFNDRNHIVGTWQYTIDSESTTGSWWADLMSAESDLEPVAIPTASIAIDGDRSDWQGIQSIVSDEEGDEDPEADFEGTDLNAFYMARDDDFLYHMITLHDGDPPADRNLVFSISYDKYPIINGGTVPGDQFSTVDLSYPPDGNMVVGLGERTFSSEGSKSIAQYGSDYAAIGGNFIEYKIPLEDMKSIDGKYTDIYVHMLDNDDDGLLVYTISDEMDSIARIADSGGGYN